MIAMISQPMNGLSDEEIKATRQRVAEWLGQIGYDVIDSFITDDLYQEMIDDLGHIKHPGVAYLGKSLEFMSAVDAVYFCKGWEKARGCRIEHAVAEAYMIPMIYEEASNGYD